jgi:hypothetical protein
MYRDGALFFDVRQGRYGWWFADNRAPLKKCGQQR